MWPGSTCWCIPGPAATTRSPISLLQHMVDACLAGGRKQGWPTRGVTAGSQAYWQRSGWPVASRAAQRRIVLADLDRAVRRPAAHRRPSGASPDYELEVVPLPTPASLVDGLLDVHRAMNDAPLDDLDLDDDEWSVERLVASETALANRELRVHRLVARRRADGEIGGYTVVVVDPATPTWGMQEDTAVVGAHRGHRLGLRLKTAMLRLLGEAEPQLEKIDTWNAESNTHMIAVNEQLGCVVVGRGEIVQNGLG